MIIENDILRVSLKPLGAELSGIYNKETALEYLWQAGELWPKHSPVLFPVVGGLKNNNYTYNGLEYTLNRHGFARESKFEVDVQTNDSISFRLTSSAATKAVYPFNFNFFVKYQLKDNKIFISYLVDNTGEETMYCSVGAHPAFKLPLVYETEYSDYYLQFNKAENAGVWPLSEDGLIEEKPLPFFDNTNSFALKKELFYKDALVFKNLASSEISILNNKNKHGLTVAFGGFDYMGIWSAKNADFVCIEPWCGIADNVNHNGELKDKEGIIQLSAGNTFERTWSVELF